VGWEIAPARLEYVLYSTAVDRRYYLAPRRRRHSLGHFTIVAGRPAGRFVGREGAFLPALASPRWADECTSPAAAPTRTRGHARAAKTDPVRDARVV